MHLLGWKESTIFPICIVYILIDLMEQYLCFNSSISLLQNRLFLFPFT